MRKVQEKSKDQARWNQYGIEMIRKIEKDPEKYIISNCPLNKSQVYNETIRLLSPIEGKRILEVGCGRGELSVWLSKQCAKVNAVDIGPNLVAFAKVLARVNHVDCKFIQSSIIDLPFDSSIYDVVIGRAILHHLSEADVVKALRECYRVLKVGGIAIFLEPVENSKLFDFIQNLFPVGKKGSSYYRPSILYRKAWANYIKTVDDRSLTNRELASGGKNLFQVVRIFPFGFLIRLNRLIGNNYDNRLSALDRFLFKALPPLRYYSQRVLVEYRK